MQVYAYIYLVKSAESCYNSQRISIKCINNFKELAPWVSQKSAQPLAELGPEEATK
jgi:hypothetical protein